MVKRRIAFAMAWVVMLTSIPWSGASANAQEYEDAQIIQEEILDEDVAVLEEQPVQTESSGTVSGENSGEEEIISQDNEEIVIESIVETADPSLDEGAEETANGEAAVPQTESEIALLTEEEGTEGQKEVTSLEWLSLPEKQTAVVSFDSDYYMDAQARVTYADGSSEDLYMYTMGIGGQSLCPLLYLRQEDGSAAAEGIDFYSADAGQTYFFGTNAGGKNYVSEQEIRILSPAECADGNVLTEGQPASFANTGETRAVSFTPKETAEYVFTVTGTSMVSRWDSEAEGFVSGALNGEGAFRVSLVAGTETWIVWKPQEGTETVSISVKKTSAEITGIAFSDLPASVSTFEFLDTVKGAVSVSYREGEQTWTEQIQNWQGGWSDYDILIGATESGDEIWIELQDSAGNPVNFLTSHYIGSYTLKAYPEAEPESEVHQEASILLEGIPETAVTVTEGAQTAPISVAQDTAAYYVFTPATTEEYLFEFQYTSDIGGVYPHLFCVDEEIFTDMGSIWSGQRIRLETGKSYLLRAEVSMEDVADLVVSFKLAATISDIFIQEFPEPVSAFELHDMAPNINVSVTYEKGGEMWTESVQNWQGGWNGYDILIGSMETGDRICLELWDSAGNQVNLSGTSYYPYSGNYILKAYLEIHPDNTATREIILLEGLPEGTIEVTEGAQTAPISVAQDTAAYYVFTPATTEEYIFEYQYLSDTGSVTPHLFCVDEEIFMDMGYIWSGQRISLEAGKSYLLRMEASMADVADLTVSFALPLRVTAVELSVQKEYSLMEMLRDDYDLSATVFYSDGSTEEIYWWQDNTESTEAGEVNIYTCWLSSGEYLTLRLFDREGGQVSIPRRYSEDAVPIGEFTLTASVDDETTLYETQLTISGAPEGTPEIALGQEISCESGAAHGGGVWFWIVPEQPGQYLLKKTGFYGDAYLLQIGETGARRIDESWGEEINFFLNAEAGARYALFLSMEEEEPYGNVSLQEPKRFLSMEADIPDTFEAFSVESELSELPVTVRYQDESSEIVSGWTTDWEEELGCNSMHAETSQGQRLLMYLTDADDNPADLPDYGYNIPVGPYSLHLLLQESGDAGELSKEIQIQLPQAEEIVPEQDYYVEITSDIPIAKSYRFRFTPDVETAGRMRIVDELHTNHLETSTEVYRFDSAAGRLIEMDAYSAAYFQVGVTYYIVGEIYNLDPATQKFSIRLEKSQSPESSTLTGMRLASPPDQTKYVEKIESVSGDGASALLTFEGGAEREVSFGDYYGDDYEYYLNEAIYKKEAGEAPTEEDRVDWWEDDPISEPGTYMLVAYAEGEDGSISFWTETPITVRSLQEASQDHRFDEEGETWIEGEGYQLYFVGFIPEADGRYEFEAGTALDLQIYQMDGLRVDILDQNDYSFSAELKGGQEYVIAVEPWRSGGFALRVGSRVEPVEILARLVAGRLVAGLDSFNPEDFLIDLRYSDESASVLRGDETDARGYRFRYEITDSEGKRVSDFSEAGLYYVKAAVYRTFSAISSEVVSEPVPVNLEKIETSGLETLEEETPYTVTLSGDRQFYAFTPAQDGCYEIVSEDPLDAGFYKETEMGMEQAGHSLKQGEAYILVLSGVSGSQEIVISSGRTLALGNPVQARAGETFFFAPEKDGRYTVSAGDASGGSSLLTLQLEKGGLGSAQGNGSAAVTASFSQGQTYSVSVSGESGTAYELSVTETPTVTGIEAEAKSTEEYVSNFYEFIDPAFLFDVTVSYSDGSIQNVSVGGRDFYGNLLEMEVIGTDNGYLELEYRQTVRFSIGGFRSGEEEIIFGGKPQMEELVENIAFDATFGEKGMDFYKIITETDGDYYVSVEGLGDHYHLYEAYAFFSGSEITEGDYLHGQAGRTIYLALRADQEMIGTDYRITVLPKKNITKMELQSPADPFFPEAESPGEEMKALVTYSDGTTSEISFGDANDGHGNKVSGHYARLNSSTVRIYLSCGDLRVFCDVAAQQAEDLPEITEGQELQVELAADRRSSLVYRFVPEEAGRYRANLSFPQEGTEGEAVLRFYDPETHRTINETESLTAGKTYLAILNIWSPIEQTTEFSLCRLGREQCGDGKHSLVLMERTEATCVDPGEEKYKCEFCDYTETKIIEAKGHSYGEEQRQEPTETEYGKVYQICQACGDEQILQSLIPKAEEKKIQEAKAILSSESVDQDQAVEAVTSIDGQALIDSGNLQILAELEEILTTPKEGAVPVAGETKISAEDGITESKVAVQGAAVTVAAALLDGTVAKEDGKTYSAEVAVTGAQTGTDPDTGKQYYEVQIDLYLLEDGQRLGEIPVQPAVPLTITIPVPEIYQNAEFELYHLIGEGAVKIGYTRSETDQTITFATPSLSPFQFRNMICISHNWGDVEEKIPATCTSAGKGVRICKVCQAEEEVEIQPQGHKWGEWEETKASTCTEEGVKSRKCQIQGCGETESEKFPKKNHEYSGEVTAAASCERDGVKTYTCKYCRDSYTEKIQALGHSWGTWKETKKPTCTADGTDSRSCQRAGCGKTESRSRGKTGHTWQNYMTVDTAASCTREGSKSVHCAVCSVSDPSTAERIPQLSHSWDGGSVTAQPTCVKNGTRTYTCRTCGAKRTETVSVTGQHRYGVYRTTKEPTVTSEGTETRSCSVCGKQESRKIAKLTPTIKLTAKKITLKVKQSTTKIKVSGLAKGDSVASWTSSNSRIVKVAKKSGKIVAQNRTGRAVLTVTLKSGLKAKVNVTVQKQTVKTTKISGIPKKITLAKGRKQTLKPILSPITSQEKITYTSSNKKIVTVSSKGVLTAKAAGKAKITVKSGRKKVSVVITVPKTRTKAIKGVPSALTLRKGRTYTLKARRSPSGSDEKLTYSTSNKRIVTVSSKGVLTAKAAGKAKITVKSGSKKVTVTVTVSRTKTKAIKGVPSALTLRKGKTYTLKARRSPSGSDEKLTYTSSNKKIATVNSGGKIKAVRKGKVRITVTSGKVKKTCVVTVK
ncbi:MAG TPA: Ig-like domain-containing protein [Candidatus Choladousia intestinavium]|uniref:Ig-like domain-containing protein n=1 Tax=Candidatus Choladousia intestinavium TaxID=2840727 RepID=A0A9D1D9E7_9FIRM|nr:Ig-like domain-containing protein [Candidatus Choladousia intestinavium]